MSMKFWDFLASPKGKFLEFKSYSRDIVVLHSYPIFFSSWTKQEFEFEISVAQLVDSNFVFSAPLIYITNALKYCLQGEPEL